MVLLPKILQKDLPPLYSQEEEGENAIARVKFFAPVGSWTWYATEYDEEQKLFFGLVVGHSVELGYFTLSELESIELLLGLKIERDINFQPKSIADIKKLYRI
jgi:hypothetical protein